MLLLCMRRLLEDSAAVMRRLLEDAAPVASNPSLGTTSPMDRIYVIV